MKPHVHLSAVHGIAIVLFIFAVFATLHMLAIAHPNNPLSRAFVTGAGM